MSASSFTDWQIACDYPGCGMSVWMTEIDLRGVSNASELRRTLKKRGWTVNVPASSVSGVHAARRLDFCPDHKPQEG